MLQLDAPPKWIDGKGAYPHFDFVNQPDRLVPTSAMRARDQVPNGRLNRRLSTVHPGLIEIDVGLNAEALGTFLTSVPDSHARATSLIQPCDMWALRRALTPPQGLLRLLPCKKNWAHCRGSRDVVATRKVTRAFYPTPTRTLNCSRNSRTLSALQRQQLLDTCTDREIHAGASLPARR